MSRTDTGSPNYYRNLVFMAAASASSVVIILITWFSYTNFRNEFIRMKQEEAARACKTAVWAVGEPYAKMLALGAPHGQVEKHCKEQLVALAETVRAEDFFILLDGTQIFSLQVSGRSANAGAEMHRQQLSLLTVGSAFVSEPFKSSAGDWYLWGFTNAGNGVTFGVQLPAEGLKRIEQLSGIMVIAGAAGLLLALFAAFWAAAKVASPLGRLTAYAARLGKAEFAEPLPHGIKGEFRLLGGTLHTMKQELDTLHTNRQMMLAQIAHEMRNPLGGIELLNNLAMEDAAAKNAPLGYFERINTELSGLKAFLASYLDFSKPAEPKSTPINLPVFMQEFRQVSDVYFQGSEIVIVPAPGLQVEFDPAHLRQILLALVANAVSAVIQVPQGKVTVECESRPEAVAVTVFDNGSGVPDELRERIFQPFFSGSRSGTGLGLAIARKLAVANGGSLYLCEHEGKYNKFVLVIPK